MKNIQLSRNQADSIPPFNPDNIHPVRPLIWCDECHYWHNGITECPYT